MTTRHAAPDVLTDTTLTGKTGTVPLGGLTLYEGLSRKHAGMQFVVKAEEAGKCQVRLGAEELVLNKNITLEYDEDCDDAYDRLLAYVSVDDTSVNKLMLERGYAKLLYIEPNKLYLDEFEAVATLAEDAKSGLWGACEE